MPKAARRLDVRENLLPNDGAAGSRQAHAAEELIEIIHSYLT
jgi:hypothetical protein